MVSHRQISAKWVVTHVVFPRDSGGSGGIEDGPRWVWRTWGGSVVLGEWSSEWLVG